MTLDLFRLPSIDLNATITLEELIRMGQGLSVEEYSIKNKFITRTLEEGLEVLGANIGDPIFIRIFKEESLLEVWIRSGTQYEHLKDYVYVLLTRYSLGSQAPRDVMDSLLKVFTPSKALNSIQTASFISLLTGYQNAYDRAHERTGSFYGAR